MLSLVWVGLVVVFVVVEMSVGNGLLFESIFNCFIISGLSISWPPSSKFSFSNKETNSVLWSMFSKIRHYMVDLLFVWVNFVF